MVLVATQVKRRRGTTAENDAFTGAEGEITVDTEKHELRVHDGLTQGGFKVGSGTGALIIGQILEVVGTADYTPVGCLLADGAEYTKAQFPNLWADFLTGTPKLQTCTYTEYANQIAEFGFCNKFAVDTTNETFKVPTRNKYRKLVKKIVNGTTWANLYDDGWVEQGGLSNDTTNASNQFATITLPVQMSDINYVVGVTKRTTDTGSNYYYGVRVKKASLTTTSFDVLADSSDGFAWKVSGYTTIPDSTANITREFVVVANGTLNQEQMDWSAWASSLAGKANIDLSNTPSNIDYVIEEQLPTADNSYTWYKKYRSGLIEQGGQFGGDGAGAKTITLPIEMQPNYELAVFANVIDGTFFGTGYKNSTTQITVWTTSFQGGMTRQAFSRWHVRGYFAQ